MDMLPWSTSISAIDRRGAADDDRGTYMPYQMTRWATTAVLATTLLGCRSSATEPPSGLPVTLSFLTTATPATPVAGGGDSVLIAVSIPALALPGCVLTRTVAGIEGSLLVVTVVPDYTVGVMCVSGPSSPVASAQAVVRKVPPGRYGVVFVRRDVPQGGSATDHEIARGTVVLPH
jgi:hypothetical protein